MTQLKKMYESEFQRDMARFGNGWSDNPNEIMQGIPTKEEYSEIALRLAKYFLDTHFELMGETE